MAVAAVVAADGDSQGSDSNSGGRDDEMATTAVTVAMATTEQQRGDRTA